MMKLYGGHVDTKENKIENADCKTMEQGLILRTMGLFKRWKFLLSFLLNQLGR